MALGGHELSMFTYYGNPDNQSHSMKESLDRYLDHFRKDIAERRWRAVLEELDAEVRQQVDLANTSDFVDYCLERSYRQCATNLRGEQAQ